MVLESGLICLLLLTSILSFSSAWCSVGHRTELSWPPISIKPHLGLVHCGCCVDATRLSATKRIPHLTTHERQQHDSSPLCLPFLTLSYTQMPRQPPRVQLAGQHHGRQAYGLRLSGPEGRPRRAMRRTVISRHFQMTRLSAQEEAVGDPMRQGQTSPRWWTSQARLCRSASRSFWRSKYSLKTTADQC